MKRYCAQSLGAFLLLVSLLLWPAGQAQAADFTFGTAAVFDSATTANTAVARLDDTHVVIAYENVDATSSATAVVGTISGNSISYGSPTSFDTLIDANISIAAISSTQVVVVYRVGGVTQAVVGTVSGTSISFGSAVALQPGTAGDNAVTALDSSKVVVAYGNEDSFIGTAVVGTVSGTSISFGSNSNFAGFGALAPSHIAAATLDSTHVVIAHQNGAPADPPFDGRAIIGTISGTSISFGSAAEFESDTASHISVTELDSSKFVVAYNDGGNSAFGTARVGSVSGTTISYGSAAVFQSSTTTYISATNFNTSQIAIAYLRPSVGAAVLGTVSGTSISFGTPETFESSVANYNSATAITSSDLVIAYQDIGNSSFGTAIVGDVSTDAIAPTVSTLSPADNATSVAVDTNLIITFSEAVTAQTGTITINRSADQTTVETIAVTSEKVTGSGTDTITINPGANLAAGTSYYITIASTAFDDTAGNSYAGISDSSTWNFTTVATPSATAPSSITQTVDGTGEITFTTTVADADSETASLKVEYSTDNSTWKDPTLGSVAASSGSVTVDNSAANQIQSIDTGTGDITLTITWKAGTDLAATEDTTVYLRLTPTDGTNTGTTVASAAFVVDTRAPAVSGLKQISGTLGGVTIGWTPGATDLNFAKYTVCYSTTAADASACSGTAKIWTSSNDAALGKQTTSETTITGLDSATTYFIALKAEDTRGNSTTLAAIEANTATPSSVSTTIVPPILLTDASPLPVLESAPAPSPEPSPQTLPAPTPEPVSLPQPSLPDVQNVTEQLAKTFEAVTTAVERVGSSPITQAVTAAAAPIAAISLAASASTVSALPNLFAQLSSLGPRLLQGLLGLLGIRGRRRPWGRIVEAQTGRPIAGAIIYVISEERQKVIETMRSEEDGSFSAFVPPGTYDFRIIKPGWEVVPDAAIPLQQIDEQVYAGRPVTVSEESLVKLVFALQPEEEASEVRSLVWRLVLQRTEYVLQRLSWPLLLFGFALSTAVLIARLDAINIGLEIFYIVLIAGKLAVEHRFERALGSVADAKTGKPLDLAAVRLYDATTGRMVATQVTSKGGRFLLRAQPGVYTLLVTRTGYTTHREAHVVIRSADKPLALTIPLTPQAVQGLRLNLAH